MRHPSLAIARYIVFLAILFHVKVGWGQEPQRLLEIGITLPLTGPAAAYGVAARNGFELARKRNPNIRERMRFRYEDTELKPARAVHLFHALQQRYRPVIHFDFGSATSLALAPIAEQRRLLLVSSAYDSAVSRSRDYVYRFANNTADYAAVITAELRRRGIRDSALVVADNPFFTQFATTLQSLMRHDEQITIHSVKVDETDFSTMALKLRHAKPTPQGLGIFLFVDQASQLLRKMRAASFGGFVFGTDAFEEVSYQQADAQLFGGIHFPNAYVTKEFINVYRTEYGTTAHCTFAASTYDFSHVLEEASRKCGACQQGELQKILEDPTVRHGALGEYRFSSSSDTGKYFASNIVIKAVPGANIVQSRGLFE